MGNAAVTGFESLNPCVHCGFCLPACPTYLATGDENDSPRGRIVLMRILESGEISPDDPDLHRHIDSCLGCLGCESACPSGVGFGAALETTRELLNRSTSPASITKLWLAVFQHPWLWKPLFNAARLVSTSGLAARAAGSGRIGFVMGMLAATRSHQGKTDFRYGLPDPKQPIGRVALFSGCLMDQLFPQVQHAAALALRRAGFAVTLPRRQGCCGAPHSHAGYRDKAASLARRNLELFTHEDVDLIAVTSAGCGAHLKGYHHLVGSESARLFASKVKDISEILASHPPAGLAPLKLTVAYEPPCHLLHAQGVAQPPLSLLSAIPALQIKQLPGSEECCGGAGIHGMTHPTMSRLVLDRRLDVVAQAEPRIDYLVTGNPGCIMQLGAGLRARRIQPQVVHPIEVVAWSLTAHPPRV